MPILNVNSDCAIRVGLKKRQFKPVNYLLGFTLLELLVVIALLGVVALAATTLIIDTGDEKRKDATEKNWDAIRKAMVGDTTLSLNNSPNLSGFVVDMGRLPNNLRELMVREFDDDNDPLTPPYFDQPAWSSIALSSAITGLSGTVTGTISGGWRGPYLYASGSDELRDGWMNKNNAVAFDDALNFGWAVSASVTSIQVKSLGDGGVVGGDDYDEDFPADSPTMTVHENDWLLTTASGTDFNIAFNKPPVTTVTNLQFRLYFFEDDPANPVNVAELIGDLVPSASGTFFEHATSATSPSVQAININQPLPIGKYAALVVCTNGASPTVVEAIYDGDCVANTPAPEKPYYFTLLPKATTPPIEIKWNIP